MPHFINLLKSKNVNIAEQAVWALGNIAGDGAVARDIVIQHNVVDGVLALVNDTAPLSFLRNIVWLMSNLCRNKNPSPPFDQIKRLLPVLSHLLSGNDIQVLADACWALSYVTDDENPKIQAVVETGAVRRLVALLGTDEPSIIVPALRTVGNIVTGTDQQVSCKKSIYIHICLLVLIFIVLVIKFCFFSLIVDHLRYSLHNMLSCCFKTFFFFVMKITF